MQHFFDSVCHTIASGRKGSDLYPQGVLTQPFGDLKGKYYAPWLLPSPNSAWPWEPLDPACLHVRFAQGLREVVRQGHGHRGWWKRPGPSVEGGVE